MRKMHYRWICLMLVMCQLLTCLPAQADEPRVLSAVLRTTSEVQNGMVRVLLSSMGYPSALDITLEGTFVADGAQDVELPDGAKIRVSMSSSSGEITLEYGSLTYAMGKTLALRRRASSGSNGFYIAQSKKSGNMYPGDLYLSARTSNGQWRLHPVAHIYIEYYLHGVLPYEMGNSAPLEALKAQAVAARTFTLRKMSGSNSLYDLTDTDADQVYYGNSTTTSQCTLAVNETKGIVLMVNGRLSGTYYTASNGGQTESVENAWGSGGYSESVVKDDPFDLQNTASTVKSAIIYKDNNHDSQPAELRALLNKEATSALGMSATVKTINAITLHTPKFDAPSRLYTKMSFTVIAEANGREYELEITADVFDQIEWMIGIHINSSDNELWTVTEEAAAFRVSARRRGHGVGMSQRGAMQMATLGYTYDRILGFYYEGSYRMQYTFSHTILGSVGNETITTTEQPADITDNDAVTATVTLADADSSVNVRDAASEKGNIIAMLPNGAQVTILAKKGDWCEVKTTSATGYIKAEFLVYNNDSEPTPTTTPSAPETIGYAYVNTPSGSLNLRSEADSNSFIVIQIPRMTKVPVHESKNGWTRVSYKGQTGWVMTTFLTMAEGDDQEDGKDENEDTTKKETAIVTTESGSLNLRQSADSYAKILAKIPRGTKITVLEKQTAWTKTSYAGQTGWVMNAFLTFEGETEEDNTITAQTTAKVTGGSLNLRAAKTTSSKALAMIPDGTTINVLETSDGWTKTLFAGYTGWVMSKYLVVNGNGGNTATPTPTTTPAPTQTNAPVPTAAPTGENGYKTAEVVGGSLNLREMATTNSRALAQIPDGTEIVVYEDAGTWCRTSYQGKSGWVMAKYLKMTSGSATMQPTATPGPTNVPENTDAPANGTNAVVIGGKLNMRMTADASASIVTRIPEGAVVSVLSPGSTWSRVQYNDRYGYVMTKYLSFAGEEALQTARVVTSSGSLNMREEADAYARVLMKIPRGSTVTVIQRLNSWCYVRYQNTSGYVMTKYLSFAGGGDNGGNVPQPTVTPTAAPDNTQTAAPTATITPVPTTTATATAAPEGASAWINVESGSLNLRKNADSDANVLALLQNRAEVTVVDYGSTWTKVRVATLTGYVQTRYLTWTKPAADPDGVDRYIGTGGGSLNLRSDARDSAGVILTIPDSAAVRLLENGTPWCRISYKGVTGYVKSEFVKTSQQKAETDTNAVYDQTLKVPETSMMVIVRNDLESVNVRQWCSTEAPTVTRLEKTHAAMVLEIGDTWCKIQLDQNTAGYCLLEYVTMLVAD